MIRFAIYESLNYFGSVIGIFISYKWQEFKIVY